MKWGLDNSRIPFLESSTALLVKPMWHIANRNPVRDNIAISINIKPNSPPENSFKANNTSILISQTGALMASQL